MFFEFIISNVLARVSHFLLITVTLYSLAYCYVLNNQYIIVTSVAVSCGYGIIIVC